jgi:hypothetical protein
MMRKIIVNTKNAVDMEDLLARVESPSGSFSIDDQFIGHSIMVTENERKRLVEILRVAVGSSISRDNAP